MLQRFRGRTDAMFAVDDMPSLSLRFGLPTTVSGDPLTCWPTGMYALPLMQPIVGIVMGSQSDMDTMEPAATVLEEFGIPYEMRVVSAHRTPDMMFEYAKSARGRGLKVIIAGAGGAAHLPGMVASLTTLPVIGVPVTTRALSGLDSLYSIVQMPAGIPVATVSIGNGRNAGILAVRILGSSDFALTEKLEDLSRRMREQVDLMNEAVSRAYPNSETEDETGIAPIRQS